MNLSNAKTLTATGAYLRRRAAQLADGLHRAKQRVAHEVIDGFILRATRIGKLANGLVIDPPGLLHTLHNEGDERGNLYSLDSRDYFNSNVDAQAIERGFADVEPMDARYLYYPIGFSVDQNPPPGQSGDPVQSSVKLRRAVVRTTDRYCFCRLSVFTSPAIGEPVFDLLPASAPGEPRVNLSYATLALLNGANVVTLNAGDTRNSFLGYAFSNAGIDDLAAGYTLIREALHGYTSFEYPLCPPASLFIGGLMVAAIPVAKQLDVGVTDWGEAGLLLVGMNANTGNPSDSLVRWSYLWTPAEHPEAVMHPGPWVYKPEWEPNLNFDEWEDAWGGDPENIGSRPSWIDSLSCALDGDTAVFRFRCVALAGVPQIVDVLGVPTRRFPTVPAEAIVEIRVDQEGNVEAAYPAYEVFSGPDAFDGYGLDVTPYQAFVDGELPGAFVRATWPVATFSAEVGLVRVDAEFRAPRDDTMLVGMPTWNGLMKGPDTNTFGVRVQAGVLDVFISFSSIGAGLTPPSRLLGGEQYLFSACQSYKLWALDSMAAMLSDTEVGLLVFEDWELFDQSTGTETRLLIVDIVTGSHRLTPRLGYFHTPTLEHIRVPVLSVIQRELKSPEGELLQAGAYLVSGPSNSAVRITRDSGLTWDDYLDFPQPAGGAYFLGNQLMPNMVPGYLIASR